MNLIKKFDLYGKEPEFYYKDKPNKKTWVGRIFTLFYLAICLAFFIYKIVRMAKRKDVTFYEINSNNGEIPSIDINKDIFYAAFAFGDPLTNEPFVDERIYTLSGIYSSQKMVNGNWEPPLIENITFENCKLSNFGKNYQNIMTNKNLSNMLCPKKSDFVLEGYYTMERFSYIKLNYQRCVNTTENNNSCFSKETIEQKLSIANIISTIEDIELTPQDYYNPVRHVERDVSGITFKGWQPTFLVEMKIVMIETDSNIIGFEAFSNPRIDKYLKFGSVTISPSPNIEQNEINLNEIQLILSPDVLYQKRKYVQLVDVFGDVGGFKEIINLIFSIICSFFVDILYNKSLVNNLFNFDLDKKLIILKNKKYKAKDDEIREIISKDKIEIKENYQIKKQIKKIKKKNNYYPSYDNKYFEKNNKSSKLNFNNIYEDKRNNAYLNHATTIIDDIEDKKNEGECRRCQLNKKNEENVMKKIENRLCVRVFFCFANQKEKINSILFDEGIKLFIEQLDIFNIFIQLFMLSKRDVRSREEMIGIQMREGCERKLEILKS